jgi:hypothetical protein
MIPPHFGQRLPVQRSTGPAHSGQVTRVFSLMAFSSQGFFAITTSLTILQRLHTIVVVAQDIPTSSPPDMTDVYPQEGQPNRYRRPMYSPGFQSASSPESGFFMPSQEPRHGQRSDEHPDGESRAPTGTVTVLPGAAVMVPIPATSDPASAVGMIKSWSSPIIRGLRWIILSS